MALAAFAYGMAGSNATVGGDGAYAPHPRKRMLVTADLLRVALLGWAVAGGDGSYAVFFEDPDRIKLEISYRFCGFRVQSSTGS